MRETFAFHITALYRDFLSYTTAELKKLELNFGQMPLILYIGKHPDCTQSDLTKALRLDWGYSQRSVSKLMDSGFIQKEHSKEKAGNILRLTEKGENAFDLCHRVFKSWDGLKTDHLTSEEKETLLFLLSKMTAERKEG